MRNFGSGFKTKIAIDSAAIPELNLDSGSAVSVVSNKVGKWI